MVDQLVERPAADQPIFWLTSGQPGWSVCGELTFKDEEGAGRGTQPGRAARLLHTAMSFMRTLESGELKPDVFHTNPRRSKTAFFEEAVRLLPQASPSMARLPAAPSLWI